MMAIVCSRILLTAGLLIAASTVSARADAGADKAAITARLQHWAAAFNARDAAGACDLFAPDLISSVPGAPDAGRDAVCARLAKLFAKPSLTLHYSPDIHEVIVSGDIAVVRLTWTLTIRHGTRHDSSREEGMDIFRRQQDGRWSIIRFIAFSIQPEQNGGLPAAAAKP